MSIALQKQISHWHLCSEHQPDRWESDGTCPICEGHTLQQKCDEEHAAWVESTKAHLVTIEERNALEFDLAALCTVLTELMRDWATEVKEFATKDDPYYNGVRQCLDDLNAVIKEG